MAQEANRLSGKLMDAKRDSADFRDRIYQPALLQLYDQLFPTAEAITVLDQQAEGACTGFGLAAMINYLNHMRGIREQVSPRMLYTMAKRHDQWPGDDYEGSSARGAMKGFHKNGVCPEKLWPYKVNAEGYFTRKRQLAALKYPLGAYYRVLKKRSDVHAALMETGALFVSAAVHDGWDKVDRYGVIPYTDKTLENGGHAFCILGYTEQGFIIQNSWGEDWGGIQINGTFYPGLAIWQYADFDKHYWDGWVARMALPVDSLQALAAGNIVQGVKGPERINKAPPQHVIADYYVHIDDGQFDPQGNYPSSINETRDLIRKAVADMSAGGANGQAGHILIYAHGGLNSIGDCAIRVDKWAKVFNANRVRQIHLIWETGFFASLKDILLGKDEFANDRAGGFGDWKDSVIEKITQPVGYALWKEMRGDADLAFKTATHAGSRTLKILNEELKKVAPAKRPRLHLMGHSAGSILLGHLLQKHFAGNGVSVESLQLFAPACTLDFFAKFIEPNLGAKKVKYLHHYYLDDRTERRDNVAKVYGKSLLYLVSRSYQSRRKVVPIMGMDNYWGNYSHPLVKSYNTRTHPNRTQSSSHGGFDNDLTTMNNALTIILGGKPSRLFVGEDLSGY